MDLLSGKSKHGDYQELHPLVLDLVGDAYVPKGRLEFLRNEYFQGLSPMAGLTVLDIGANTGYFSFGALAAGAAMVRCFEGNKEHAEFIRISAELLGLSERVDVRASYFEFFNGGEDFFDLALCLNVLHHVGDDFGDSRLGVEGARSEILKGIRAMKSCCNYMWLQVGFNWRGDVRWPLFADGSKEELIDFVVSGVSTEWEFLDIAVFDPAAGRYLPVNDENIKRFDSLGEFLNRPIFFMRNKSCVSR